MHRTPTGTAEKRIKDNDAAESKPVAIHHVFVRFKDIINIYYFSAFQSSE